MGSYAAVVAVLRLEGHEDDTMRQVTDILMSARDPNMSRLALKRKWRRSPGKNKSRPHQA
jgi:hypothetical protein